MKGTIASAFVALLLFVLFSPSSASSLLNNAVNSANLDVMSPPLSPSRTPNIGGPVVEFEDGVLMSALSPVPIDGIIGSQLQSDQISTYVVREGDTLSEIADMFGVSPNTIRWTNQIRYNNVIRVGQKLIILPISGVKYEVKKGDTLAKIAKTLKADAQEIADYNKIAIDADLTIGDELIIPNGTDVVFVADQVGRSSLTKTYAKDVSGYFSHPLSGAKKTQGLHGHNGYDFGAPTGTSVRAAASGEVVIARAGYNGGYGNYVAISHSNGTQTLYAHLNTIGVQAGDWVSQGQTIGTVGSTGRSTGPHLHFEVRGGKNPF